MFWPSVTVSYSISIGCNVKFYCRGSDATIRVSTRSSKSSLWVEIMSWIWAALFLAELTLSVPHLMWRVSGVAACPGREGPGLASIPPMSRRAHRGLSRRITVRQQRNGRRWTWGGASTPWMIGQLWRGETMGEVRGTMGEARWLGWWMEWRRVVANTRITSRILANWDLTNLIR